MASEFLTLPRFRLLDKQHDPPHRKRLLASAVIDGITYKVASNWPRTAWYVWASRDGYRASQSVSTRSSAKAEMWVRCVTAGLVGRAPAA